VAIKGKAEERFTEGKLPLFGDLWIMCTDEISGEVNTHLI